MKTNVATPNSDQQRNLITGWRPSNDVSVSPICLCKTPPLNILLALAHVKARLLGLWRTLPTPVRSSETEFQLEKNLHPTQRTAGSPWSKAK